MPAQTIAMRRRTEDLVVKLSVIARRVGVAGTAIRSNVRTVVLGTVFA